MRCIFLRVDDLDPMVQEFRQIHDPLADLIEPHITLVFPFDSDVSDEVLIKHIGVVACEASTFSGSFHHAQASNDGYVYLPIGRGAKQISDLHDRLYTGALAKFLTNRPYVPHLTIGRTQSDQVANVQSAAVDLGIVPEFGISTMVLERVDDQNQSISIAKFNLGEGLA